MKLAPSQCPGKIILFFSLYQLPAFYPVHFQCHEMSSRFLYFEGFAGVISLSHVHPFCHYHFLHLCRQLGLPHGCRSGAPWTAAMSTFHSRCFSHDPTDIQFQFHFQHHHLCFAALSPLLANAVFWLFILKKHHMAVSLGDKKGAIIHLAVCAGNWVSAD